MGRFAHGPRLPAWMLAATATAALCGCANNPMVMQGQMTKMQEQQAALARQNEERQTRLSALDRANQESESLLAQSRQQNRVLEDQLTAVREQLRGATAQLADAQSQKQSREKQVQALTASMQRRGGVSITPNSSLLQTLPSVTGARRDGDVIRVPLSSGQLFESANARLRAGAADVIVGAANEILRSYPNQILGIEGHTDSDPVAGSQWRNNHELSMARAMAVYDVLVSRTAYKPDQLFVVGHGANHPIASNGSTEGKQLNRRVELVVYPEKRN